MELTAQERAELQTIPRLKFEELCERLSDAALREVLKVRCEVDRELFAKVFFEDDCYRPFSRMHLDFLTREKAKIDGRVRGKKEADAAPRGNAKSTIRVLVELVHDIVYLFERFIVIISDTKNLSTDRCMDVRTQLETNERLRWVYGDLTSKKNWNQNDFTTNNGVRVLAKSMGASVRGLKHGKWRPTKIVLDDAEDSDNVRSPMQREKAESYLKKDILKAGKAYTNLVFVGTVLHSDSLLMNTLNNPGWDGRLYKSVISWPKRTDLWEQARLIFVDLTRGSEEKRYQAAHEFYEQNQAAMDEGAEVLWPEEEPIFDLFVQLWTEGEASFLSEKQNEPRDPSKQLFDMPSATFFRVAGEFIEVLSPLGEVARKVKIADCTLYGWLDPATGKDFGTDYSAIVDVLVDKHGYAYVFSAWLEKVGQDEQVREMFRRHAHYIEAFGFGYRLFGFEDNGFQETYKPCIERIAKEIKEAGGEWKLPVKGITSSSNKEDRISTLQPDIKNGWLSFNVTLKSGELYRQFDQFPTASNDDGPDATERAVRLSGKKRGRIAAFDGGL